MKYRTKKINLVLLGGKAQAGKSTAAKYLYDRLSKFLGLGVMRLGFAEAVKDIATKAFGWDGKKDERGRRLLQVIGTDAGRAYDEDMWVRKMENHLLTELPHIALIDDWRFPNEKSFYENSHMYEITSIRIERPTLDTLSTQYSHLSELALPSAISESLVYNKDGYYNFSVFNDTSLSDLYGKLDNIYDHLVSKLIEY